VNQGGVTIVQNHILKSLCENESIRDIVDQSRGKVILEERLLKKHILLVLDDVCDDGEMYYLVSRQMLKEGSMCIVTSRNRHVIEKATSFDVKQDIHIHDVQLLSELDSRSLFACHAFGGDLKVPPRFGHLVQDISMACGGVPLVLKVCGSLLTNVEDVEIWEEVLKKLHYGTIMDERKILDCLRISYDSLQEQHQEMFLDIACTLLGESIEMAKFVWRSQGWPAALGVQTLVEKALITVDEEGAFHMHDHLRDMGRAIAKQESASLGVCKRLWGLESLALLKKNEVCVVNIEL
jgi:hypothetical protein